MYLNSFNLIEISTLDVELRCIPLLRLSSLNRIQILGVRVELYPLSFNLVEIQTLGVRVEVYPLLFNFVEISTSGVELRCIP